MRLTWEFTSKKFHSQSTMPSTNLGIESHILSFYGGCERVSIGCVVINISMEYLYKEITEFKIIKCSFKKQTNKQTYFQILTLYPTQPNPSKIGLNNLAVWSIQRAPCHQASLVAQLVKNLPAVWETWVRSLGWEDPLEKGKATHSSILAWRIP